MKSLKYRPMAVIGFTALITMFAAVISGFVFGGGVVLFAVGSVLTALLAFTKELTKKLVAVYICAAMMFSGLMLMGESFFGFDAAMKFDGKKCDVVATVTDDVSVYNNSQAYVLKTESVCGSNIKTNILTYSKTSFNYKPGDKIRVSLKLNDNINSRTFGSRLSYISQEEYLFSVITDATDIKLVKDGEKSVQRRLYLIRNEIKNRIYSFLPCEEGAVTVAMLIGDKSGVDAGILNNFNSTGVSHLFAVSGLHLSVWIMSIYYVLRRIIKKKRLPEIVCIIFTLFFMALTGFTASVCRAGIMLFVILLANAFNEDSDSLNSLGLSVFIILIFNPMSAVSVSLLLSFLATLGIIYAFPPVERKIIEKMYLIDGKYTRRFFKYILSLIGISVCASLFTIPVSAFFIGSISTIAPITNIFVSLPATAQMVSGGISAVFYGLRFISRPAALICGFLAKYIVSVTSFLSKIPFSSVNTESIYFRLSVIFIVSGVLCVIFLTDKIKNRIISFISIILTISITSSCLYYFFDFTTSRVDVFNTGKGIAVQIYSDGYTALLGCGGSGSFPEEDVLSGIETDIDLLLLPGREKSDCAYFIYFIDNYAPKKVVCGQRNQSSELLHRDCIVSDRFTVKPKKDFSVEFTNDGANSFAYASVKNKTVLIIYHCADADSIPEIYCDADILVVTEDMPDSFDYKSFGCVIAAGSEKICDSFIPSINNEKIMPLCLCGNIEIDIKSGEQTKIYCSKR